MTARELMLDLSRLNENEQQLLFPRGVYHDLFYIDGQYTTYAEFRFLYRSDGEFRFMHACFVLSDSTVVEDILRALGLRPALRPIVNVADNLLQARREAGQSIDIRRKRNVVIDLDELDDDQTSPVCTVLVLGSSSNKAWYIDFLLHAQASNQSSRRIEKRRLKRVKQENHIDIDFRVDEGGVIIIDD